VSFLKNKKPLPGQSFEQGFLSIQPPTAKKGIITMTLSEKNRYATPEELKIFFAVLQGKKFKLDCGHHVTFGHFLGNNITILNGNELKIICFNCSQ